MKRIRVVSVDLSIVAAVTAVVIIVLRAIGATT